MSATAAVSTLSIATLLVPEERVTQGAVQIQPLEPLSRDLVPNTLSAQPLVTHDHEQLSQSETHALVVSPGGLVPIGAPEGTPSRSKPNAVAPKDVVVTKQLVQQSTTSPGKHPAKRKRFVYQATPEGAEAEASLYEEIEGLWSIHKEKDGALRGGRRELKELGAKLGPYLSEYKKILVGSGRGGKWSEFLRELKIPKATADRYVNKWELAQAPKAGNVLNEEITEPSTETIAALVKKLKPQIVRALTTHHSISLFLAELEAELKPMATDK
jgi:hypothetical protein